MPTRLDNKKYMDSVYLLLQNAAFLDCATQTKQLFYNSNFKMITIKENIVDAKSQWEDIKALRLVN